MAKAIWTGQISVALMYIDAVTSHGINFVQLQLTVCSVFVQLETDSSVGVAGPGVWHKGANGQYAHHDIILEGLEFFQISA